MRSEGIDEKLQNKEQHKMLSLIRTLIPDKLLAKEI